MLALLGNIFLYLGMLFALLQSAIPAWGYWKNNALALAFARPAAWGQLLCILCAYLILTTAFLTNDFSIAYVAANSHASLPLLYRITALWGAHEGSLLLWLLLLAVWTFVFSLSKNSINQHFKLLTLAILGTLSGLFLVFLYFTSNPFLVTDSLQTGQDLNPLLQDPGFVIHPPMLYLGYVGFAVPFAITLTYLLQGIPNRCYFSIAKHYAIAAWCFLSLGILLGSWWAYRVLGWGGFWFWDPVENASLLPWLSGTALIHILIVAEKRDIAKTWAALLAILSFALSLLGTFLVRSGVLISVHTFANDPGRGVFLLGLFAIVSLSALAIVVLFNPPKLKSVYYAFLSRENSLLLNSIILITAMLTILLGTLYPLIIDALHLGNISVGAPYYNCVLLPFLYMLLIVMGAGMLCDWRETNYKKWCISALKNLLIAIVITSLMYGYFISHLALLPITVLSLCGWVTLNLLSTYHLKSAMHLAHLGFVVLIIGITLSSTLSIEREVRIKPGEQTPIGPYKLAFINVQSIKSDNYHGIGGHFAVIENNRVIANLYPEKRIYPIRDAVITKVAIHPGIIRELYIALGEPQAYSYWSLRIYYKPFIRWIWLGGLFMIAGGLLSLLRRR